MRVARERAATTEGDVARPSDALTAATDALRVAATHAERLLSMVTAPAETLLEQHQALNARLLDRIERLEASHASLVEAREAALDRAEERRAVAMQAQADIAMRERALGMLEETLPGMVGGLAGGERSSGALRLLKSLDAQMIDGLLEAELLTDEQKTWLRQATGHTTKEKTNETIT